MPIRPENRALYPANWGSEIRPEGEVHDATTGEYMGVAKGSEYPGVRFVRIVLTIAHLHDPNPANCADDNLAALCQRCHNTLDAPMRRANARVTRRKTKADGDLFA